MMNQAYKGSILFQPVTVGSLSLRNRVVMAPMTRGFSPDGVPGDDVAAYYGRRAAHGVGLIITEGTLIRHPAASCSPDWPLFYGEKSLKGWEKTVQAVHRAGGKIMPQLWHVGMSRKKGDPSNPHPEVDPVGPSGIDEKTLQPSVRPMSHEEIEQIVTAFAEAAGAAKKLGFDGIEIHGAHGYLIDEFLWDQTNRRTDEYGGTLQKRTRFAAEVVKACRKAVGPDFPISFRFSQWKENHYDAKLARTPEELQTILMPLAEAGVDIFHASTRRYWEPEFEGSSLNLAGWARKLTGKTSMTVGSVGLDTVFTDFFEKGSGAAQSSLDPLIERMDNHEFDLAAVGRALLADPAWAEKTAAGRESDIMPFSKKAVSFLS